MIKNIFQRIGTKKENLKAEYLPDLPALEKIIQYRFRDKNLLILALKHRSYLNVSNEQNYLSNERLELLGDAVLELITTEYLYHTFPHQDEGNLSKMRSVLVSRLVLGKIATELELGAFLILNHGEEKTGGRSRPSNLANLFEALLGGIYLDGGYKPAKAFVEEFVLKNSAELLAHKSNFNYKSTLLEYAQAKGWSVPKYQVAEEAGPDHNKRFKIQVFIENIASAQGQGSSKKKAEQKAAAQLLKTLEQDLETDYGTQN